MGKAMIFAAIAVGALVTSIYLIHKSQPSLGEHYWKRLAPVSLAVLGVLSVLALYNLLFYSCVAFLVVIATRKASKHIFSSPNGPEILGVYFGLWLSFPFGVYLLAA